MRDPAVTARNRAVRRSTRRVPTYRAGLHLSRPRCFKPGVDSASIMALRAGDKLGPYESLNPIGKGGMGEVYRVRDTRLGRDVAVKVSAEHFGERFEREARAVGSLNHPNICTLHDVGP